MRIKETAALFALLLAACGEMRWTRPDTDDAAASRDASACSKLAAERSARMGVSAAPPLNDPRFGTTYGPSAAQQRLQEAETADQCMRDKGYRLVPVDK